MTPIAPIASSIQPINSVTSATPTGAARAAAGTSFADMLGNAVQNVQGSLANADTMAMQLAAGGDVDIPQVMIAMESASLGLQTGLQVRNKALEAYKEIMAMPL